MTRVTKLADRRIGESRTTERPTVDVVETIRILLSQLSPGDRERVVQELAQAYNAVTPQKSGDVLGAIIKFLPNKQKWSVEEIKQEVREQGVEAKPKEVYNAIGYLARRGRIRKIAYGRYVVDGTEVHTTDDLGVEGSRHDDDYRTDS